MLCLLPAIASAQSVRGVVVDRADAAIPGVVVLLLDAGSMVHGRALTNERGEFRVVGAASGTYRIRTMRIGYRPVTSELLQLTAGQEVTQRVSLVDLPVALDTIRVADRKACDVRPDTAAATFAIWEQVRAALTAAQLTAGNRTMSTRLVAYQRTLESRRRGRVLHQTSHVQTGFTTRPWKSLSADSLRKSGYVVQGIDGTLTYYAPDLSVLLSDAFIEDHCFRIAAGSDANRIGIAFEPTRERRRLPDIGGTLWLDRKSSELRRLEFHYENLSLEQRSGDPGGEMEFVRMKNGAWVISRWSIKMPVLRMRQVAASGLHGSRARINEVTVTAISVEGGDLALVMRNRDTLWARPPVVLAGTVLDSVSGAKIAGAAVVLRGTSLSATTDIAGRFRIPDVLPGEYTLDITSPSLKTLGAVHSVPLLLADGIAPLAVRVPTAGQLAASLCGSARDGIVAGIVRTRGDSMPSRNVRVVVEWTEFDVRAEGILKRQRWKDARSDARGTYRICGVPVNTALVLRVESDSGGADPLDIRIPDGQRIASADLILDAGATGTAVFSGVVMTDVNGQPVADAEVALPELAHSVFTDSTGRFRISGIPAGAHIVVVRRVGYKPHDISITFAANQVVERPLLITNVQLLETVQVDATGVIASFEEHRKRGLGRFITRAELAKQEGRRMSDILGQLPGVHIDGSQATAAVANVRKGTVRHRLVDLNNPSSIIQVRAFCYPHVYINNTLVYSKRPGETPFNVNSFVPGSVEAIEYYESAGQVPARYFAADAECGVLVIHLRRGK